MRMLNTIGVVAAFIAAAGICAAQGQGQGQAGSNSTQNVNVANTPAVNIGTLPAVTIGSTALTNVGVLPSKQVQLAYNAFFNSQCSTKIGMYGANGALLCFDMANFQGQILIVTDIEWTATAPSGSTCFAGAGVGNPFFLTVATADPSGNAATHEHSTTGIKMTGTPGVSSNCGNLQFFMQGYLLTNQ